MLVPVLLTYRIARLGRICQKWPDARPSGARAEIRYIPT